MREQSSDTDHGLDVAIIGMAGRFPGARDADELWRNLRDGVESVHFLSDEELLAAGVDAATLSDPRYVKAAAVLDGVELFDAEFFQLSPLEAKVLDPQRRIFFECCWHALEDAGYDCDAIDRSVGVYAGSGLNSYLLQNVLADEALVRSIGVQQLVIGSDKDFLPTHVSYKLNLTGPSVNVNSACSTSLVAIHLARQALILGECDVALAGGSSINVPQRVGYEYVENGIQSPDGHCRAFDARARGTVWGSGCGVVVLKRLADALADGDIIRAVIKGSAINNDGANKVGYTAPSVEGQAKVVAQALASAGVLPSSISYVEAHGTGTEMGDPIEIAALTQAYRVYTDSRQFCALGSIKTNIGHLNAAAGVAGLIKVVLSLEARELPASLHFEAPNPNIDFASSPFFVNRALRPWHVEGGPRRACVSSLGIGGTNAHVVLEEAPAQPVEPAQPDEREHWLVLSARTSVALEAATQSLAAHLAGHLERQTGLSLRDVAFTLQCGRKSFARRRAVVARSLDEAVSALQQRRFVSAADVAGSQLERWLAGDAVDFRQLYRDERPRRVRLPGYAFDRQRLWIDPPQRVDVAAPAASYWHKRSDMADWFYRPQWRQASLASEAEPGVGRRERVLVFSDGSSLARQLSERLRRVAQVLTVTPGPAYRYDADQVSLPPGDDAAYRALWAELRDRDRLPERVLHFWSCSAEPVPGEPTLDALVDAQERGLSSVLRWAQAMGELNITRPARLIVFTREVYDICGDERIAYEHGSLSSACRVLQQEYTNLVCRAVDLGAPPPEAWQEAELAAALEREVRASCADVLCAYRRAQRWLPYYEPVRVEAKAPLGEPGQTYLLYYGLDGIGFLLARHLLERGVRLILLEELDFPDASEWGVQLGKKLPRDLVSQRVGNAVGLQALGHEFVIERSDFSDPSQLRQALERAEAQLGPIRGIIHAAGASNFERIKPIRDTDVATCRRQFAAIPHSLMVLDQLFRDRDLELRLVMSSLGSVLGGLGFWSIVSACSMASAYTVLQNKRHPDKWAVQLWDSWDIEWRKAKGIVHRAMYERVAPSVLTEQEGLESFARCLAMRDATMIAISGTDLQARYDKWVKLEGVRPDPADDQRAAQQVRRPELATPYVAPRNPLERSIASLYQQLLGLDRVGVDDNFHELGGHSLLATQMISRLREALEVDVELFVLMDHPTVAGLARHLEPRVSRAA